MTPEEFLYLKMVNTGMDIIPGTLESLREAIKENNIFFFEKEGEPFGFLTWYLEGNTLFVINQCRWKDYKFNLYTLRRMFHQKYPNLEKVKWFSGPKNKNFEVNLRGALCPQEN